MPLGSHRGLHHTDGETVLWSINRKWLTFIEYLGLNMQYLIQSLTQPYDRSDVITPIFR